MGVDGGGVTRGDKEGVVDTEELREGKGEAGGRLGRHL